ncbi:hypothetical protein QLX08_000857 [Tetragonisca angustula]|uniref:Uncharacterized protein n=1 Tax=Tetragonisca angustula TaxID=166442 RepID=A0AAW1AKT7_9HYME
MISGDRVVNRAVEDPFEERVPVGLHLASTTQKATAVDRNNVYTTASCGVLLHCRCGELTRVDPGKVGPTDSLVRISREMDDVSAGNCAKAVEQRAGGREEEKKRRREGNSEEESARMEWKSVLSETSRFQFGRASIRDITRSPK